MRAFPFDLHVLSTPPAFVLSQDQTLQTKHTKQQKTIASAPVQDKPKTSQNPQKRRQKTKTTTPQKQSMTAFKKTNHIIMTSQKPATTTKKTNNTLSSSQTTSHNHHTPTTEAQQPQRPTQHYTPPPKHTNHQHNTTKQPTTKQNKAELIIVDKFGIIDVTRNIVKATVLLQSFFYLFVALATMHAKDHLKVVAIQRW